MEEYLEKRNYIHRKSHNVFQIISISLSVGKFLFSASGLSGFIFLPLSALSLGAGIIEVIDKSLSISERKENYKYGYKFYKQLLNLYKAGQLTEEEIYQREADFIENLKHLPLEKYVKKTKLNGYKYVN